MTNDAVRAVVITGKYAVRASPREKRNIEGKFDEAVLVSGLLSVIWSGR